MKTILYMAISADGKTTGKDEDVSWVSDDDIERMDKLMVDSGVMVMGSRTYQSFGDELPNDKALQVVLSNQEELLKKEMENVIFTNKTPKGVISMLNEKNFNQILLAGGSELNTSFLEENLIDEIWLIQKPLILGHGKPLFSKHFQVQLQLQLLEKIELDEDSQELRYLVKK